MTQDLQHKIESILSRNPQADDREILFQLRQFLDETALQNMDGKETKNIADLVAEHIQQLNGETEQNAMIKTGFVDLDRLTGGFHLGEFVVVGGRPGMGKTLLLVNLSLNISETNPLLYLTLDLSEFLLTNKFISAVTRIEGSKILQHDLNEEQKNKLAEINNEFSKRKLFIHDSYDRSIAALKAVCRKQIQENGIQVIVVDYLQLITSYNHRKYREIEVSYICRELKNMAKENNVCVIVASQLSRSVESRSFSSKRPLLSDLRDSGSIEQDADKVLFIYRPEYYKLDEFEDYTRSVGLAEIIVAKNRTGCLADFRLSRDNHFTTFRDYEFKDEFTFSSDRLLELEEKIPY